MSALFQAGLAGDLFHKNTSALGSFEYEEKESRTSYGITSKKKRRAPQPPTGLSQYKPRILSLDSSSNVPVPHNQDSPVPPPRPSRGRGVSTNDTGDTKPILMGDKDVPMMLTSQHDPQDLDLHVSQLNLTSHDTLGEGQDMGTDNPLFSLHDESVSATASEPSSNPLFNPHEDNTTAPQVTNNPLLNMHEESTTFSQPTDSPLFNMHDNSTASLKLNHNSDLDDADATTKDREPEGVYIPAPDYEEEELTMTIYEEPVGDYSDNPRRPAHVYKEYDGEDFGQYLSDEENSYEDILRRPSRPRPQMDHKSKTEAKRPHNKKREALPIKTKKDKNMSGYSSLRTFSYADSKFGAVIENRKQSRLPSQSEDTKEAQLFINTGASYEQFLRSKNGGDLGPEDSDHSFRQETPVGYQGQVHSKDSVWKRLTWKVKKQVNSFDVTASS